VISTARGATGVFLTVVLGVDFLTVVDEATVVDGRDDVAVSSVDVVAESVSDSPPDTAIPRANEEIIRMATTPVSKNFFGMLKVTCDSGITSDYCANCFPNWVGQNCEIRKMYLCGETFAVNNQLRK
jgi:hypothetical protein